MPFDGPNGFFRAPKLPTRLKGSTLEAIAEYMYETDPESCSKAFLRLPMCRALVRPQKKHQFITVALPTEKINLVKLKKTISKLNYEYLENGYLTVEFYSGKQKENLHLHILKDGIYNKTKLIRDMSRKFKVSDNFVNVKKGTTESDYYNRLSYLRGEKVDEQKKENSELDRIWREKNDIQQN